MPFIRVLNNFITSEGTKENTEDRITYRGVKANLFQNISEGDEIRIVNFNCSSEDPYVAKSFQIDFLNSTAIEFSIPEG